MDAYFGGTMALCEGGVIAAVIVALGLAPRRAMPLQAIVVPQLPMPQEDTFEDVSADLSGDVSDTSTGPTSPETSQASKLASTRAFVKWWRSLEDIPHEITQRYLLSLYAEFCEVENVIPLSDRQLLNKIKSHGVNARRPPAKIVDGKMHRPTLYAPRRMS